MKTKLLALLSIALLAPLAATAAEPAAAAKDAKNATVKPYPLATCIVTDNDLGSMGDEKVITHEGREIKFCCAPCEKKFRRNPARYLEKLAPKPEAAATATEATAP